MDEVQNTTFCPQPAKVQTILKISRRKLDFLVFGWYFVQIKHFHTADFAIIYMEAEGCSDYVETLKACRARIQDHHIEVLVIHHLEYMGMATDENVRTVVHNQGVGITVVFTGISPYVGHQHLHTSAGEKAVQRIVVAQVVIVAVAANSHKGFETGNLGCGGKSPSEIPCVPDFINGCKELLQRLIKYAVGV